MKKGRVLAATMVAAGVFSALMTLGAGGAMASGGGGGGGGTPAPSCVGGAKITQFDNLPGYGKYSPYVAGMRTTLTVQNCTSTTVSWYASLTYDNGMMNWCNLPTTIPAGASASCRVDEQYLSLKTTYKLTASVMETSYAVLATATKNATTPSVPNPNFGG